MWALCENADSNIFPASSVAFERVQQLLQPGLRCSRHPGVPRVQRSVKPLLMFFFTFRHLLTQSFSTEGPLTVRPSLPTDRLKSNVKEDAFVRAQMGPNILLCF